MKYIVAGMVGYGLSLLLGHFVTTGVVEWLHEEYGPSREKSCALLPKLTGTLDRILYTTAWITGFNAFIGVWLLVKVARGWRVPGQPREGPSSRKKDNKQCDEVSKYEVGRYNIFIIGNALCVIFGVGGGILIQKILQYWCVWFK